MSNRGRAVVFYRGLLCLYPAEFRDHFAPEMCRTFADLLRDEQRLAVLLPLYFGVLIDGPREHLHMIRQDLIYALRSMRRDRLTALIATVVLALGIGSIATVFTLIDGMMLRPLPYPDQQRLAYVEEFKAGGLFGAMAYPNFLDFRARNRSLDDLALFGAGDATLRGDQDAERVSSTVATGALFRILGVAPLLGRWFEESDTEPKAPAVVLLGEDLWRRRYGADAGILGRTIVLGSYPARVVGVMPRGFHFPDRAELWYPLQTTVSERKRTDHGLEAIGRLRRGVSTEQAEADLRSIMEQITREHPAETYRQTVNVTPFRARNTARIRPALRILAVAVCFVLLIACANIANLLLAKSSARSREMAVRSALGASRSRLVRQYAVEALLLGACGAIGGSLLAWAAVPALLSLAPAGTLPVWMRFTPDATVLLFVACLSVATAVAAALAPALAGSRTDVIETLKEGGRSGSAGAPRSWFRQSLVVAEVAMSVVLLAGAGLMVRSFLNLSRQRLGYVTDRVVTLQTSAPAKRYPQGPEGQELVRSILREFRAIPGVAAAAASTAVPLLDGWGRSFTVEGAPLLSLKDAPLINHTVVTPGYFHTLGIPLLEGRDFDEHDGKSPLVTIVDEELARRYWPGESAIGKRVRYGPPEDNEPWHTVIAVAGMARNQSLRDLRRNSVYLPEGEFQFSGLSYLVRSAPGAPDLTPALRARLAAIDRNVAVSRVMTLEQVISGAAWQERFVATVVTAFGGLALVLAVVGLYGVMAYAVSRRTHELGIRMALGASAGEIRRMVLAQSGRLVGAGLVIGAAAAAGLTRLLSAQLFGVRPGDPGTLAGVSALLTMAALAASYIPARRATRVDPMTALRDE